MDREKIVEKVAAAIKVECEEFTNPVSYYVEHEFLHRWEKENPEGDFWDDAPEELLNDELRDWKIIARAAIDALGE